MVLHLICFSSHKFNDIPRAVMNWISHLFSFNKPYIHLYCSRKGYDFPTKKDHTNQWLGSSIPEVQPLHKYVALDVAATRVLSQQSTDNFSHFCSLSGQVICGRKKSQPKSVVPYVTFVTKDIKLSITTFFSATSLDY